MHTQLVKQFALECGFELAGIAAAEAPPEFSFYLDWLSQGMAGEMRYLTDHRAALRSDLRSLLPSVRSVICVGKLYHTPYPRSTEFREPGRGWISRYAWGEDYHLVVRRGLERLVARLQAASGASFEYRIAVDTAPLLERAFARRAGLGWIGKNTCLINQRMGSWFVLGELLTSLELEPAAPPPARCGSCRRCIEACPTQALVPVETPGGPSYQLDARRCISYLTIELRGLPIPEELARATGCHVFGCDICQDVCPWNRRAPTTAEPAFAPRHFAPPLAELAAMTEEEFRRVFRDSPVLRARYAGFERNVAAAIANASSRAANSELDA